MRKFVPCAAAAVALALLPSPDAPAHAARPSHAAVSVAGARVYASVHAPRPALRGSYHAAVPAWRGGRWYGRNYYSGEPDYYYLDEPAISAPVDTSEFWSYWPLPDEMPPPPPAPDPAPHRVVLVPVMIFNGYHPQWTVGR